jgi:hypothetical protein
VLLPLCVRVLLCVCVSCCCMSEKGARVNPKPSTLNPKPYVREGRAREPYLNPQP